MNILKSISLLISIFIMLFIFGCSTKQTVTPPPFQKGFPTPSVGSNIGKGPMVTRQPIPVQKVEETQKTQKEDVQFMARNPFMPIYFELGSHTIHSTQIPKLQANAAYLLENKNVRIKLVGHSDKIGEKNVSANMQLSKMRANEVKLYLIMAGIDEKRIASVAEGSSKAIMPAETTNLNRAIDRRVDFMLLPF